MPVDQRRDVAKDFFKFVCVSVIRSPGSQNVRKLFYNSFYIE